MTSPVRILILGGAGQVGTELRTCAWPEEASVHAPSRDDVDLLDERAVETLMDEVAPSVVINAAAFTNVDDAERMVGEAWRVNALAPALLAAASARRRLPIVHVSTDYVFDGSKDAPYVETDSVAPLGVYGASKEGGEQAVRTANPRHVIVRTAWVVSAHRRNFVKTMLRLAAERDELRVVDDQVGCPTSARDLAAALAAIAERLVTDPSAPIGTYHAVSGGEATWRVFAAEIIAQSAERGARVVPVNPIATADFPTPAQRPANSRLACEKLLRDYGLQLPAWQEGLAPILDELVGQRINRSS